MVNKSILVGRLGQDPEVKYLQSGQTLCKLNMATSHNYKDKNGDWQERTEWHNIEIWGDAADRHGDNLSKGDLIYVEGRKQTDIVGEKPNQKRFIKVKAFTVRYLDTKGKAGSSSGGNNKSGGPNPDFEESFDNDDIPF